MELMSKHKMFCHRLTRVIPAPGKAIKRVLLEFSFHPGIRFEDELTVETETRHLYSDQFKDLVDAFYLEEGDY